MLNLKIILLLICAISFNGCITQKKNENQDIVKFKNIYEQFKVNKTSQNIITETEKKITISTSNITLKQLLRWITNNNNISIICDEKLDEKQISIDVKNIPITDVLTAVAKRINVDLTQSGNLYYMGTLRPEDRGLLVRKVKRLSDSELKKAIDVMLSDVGKSTTHTDGLIICSDRVKILQKINEMLNKIELVESNVWIVQFYLINMQNTFNKEFGIDTDATIDLAVNFANAGNTNEISGALNALMQASTSTGKAKIIAEPLMLLLDGTTAKLSDGSSVPIPQKTVSDSGTVSTTGYETVDTGLTIKTSLREVNENTAQCNINIALNSISGYVDEAPIVTGQTFNNTTVLKSGGVYLIGAMTKKNFESTDSGTFFNTLKKKANTTGKIQIWCRLYKIAAPVTENNLVQNFNEEGPEYDEAYQ